jgi:hypothetical protein
VRRSEKSGQPYLQRGGGDGGVPVLGESLPFGAAGRGGGRGARTAVLGGRKRRDGGARGDGHGAGVWGGAVRCGGSGRGWRTRALRTAWSAAAPAVTSASASASASPSASPAPAWALGLAVAGGGRRALAHRGHQPRRRQRLWRGRGTWLAGSRACEHARTTYDSNHKPLRRHRSAGGGCVARSWSPASISRRTIRRWGRHSVVVLARCGRYAPTVSAPDVVVPTASAPLPTPRSWFHLPSTALRHVDHRGGHDHAEGVGVNGRLVTDGCTDARVLPLWWCSLRVIKISQDALRHEHLPSGHTVVPQCHGRLEFGLHAAAEPPTRRAQGAQPRPAPRGGRMGGLARASRFGACVSLWRGATGQRASLPSPVPKAPPPPVASCSRFPPLGSLLLLRVNRPRYTRLVADTAWLVHEDSSLAP